MARQNPNANLNSDGSKPYSKVKARDFTSLESLTRRHRKTGGFQKQHVAPEEIPQRREQVVKNAREKIEKTELASLARVDGKITYLTQGDVVGSWLVEEVNRGGTHITAICVCGKRQVKSAASILEIDVCKHYTAKGTKHDSVAHKRKHGYIFEAWRRLNQECIDRRVSMFPEWQDFRRFALHSLNGVNQWRKGGAFLRVCDPDHFREENPDYYYWFSSGVRKSLNSLGHITVNVDGELYSVIQLATRAGVTIPELAKMRREHDVSDLGLYHYIKKILDRKFS
ncbi:hypothetical protein [Vibrio phage vB_VhaS-a]|nr:hypothetical protein [Vibrio phage vB_VhaS-a]